MTPSRYQDWGASLGGGFDVADETLDRPAGFDLDDDIDDDFEANLEAEALTKGFGGIGAMGLDVTVLTAFGSQGFNTTPQFRKTWIALLRANRVRSSAGFRADFCKARHFRRGRLAHYVKRHSHSDSRWGIVARPSVSSNVIDCVPATIAAFRGASAHACADQVAGAANRDLRDV